MRAPGKGDRRGYSWPPFEAGHERSVVSGAHSPRRVEPRAAEIASAIRADPSSPEWLRLPQYAAALAAYARTEAIVSLLTEWLDTQDLGDVLTDTTRTAEVEERTKTRTTRRSTQTRVVSVLDQLHRAETRANSLRRELGLTPASAARLTRDLSQSRWYAGASPLDKALSAIEAKRQAAVGAGGDGGG